MRMALTTMLLLPLTLVARDDESSYLLTSDDLNQIRLVKIPPDAITIKDKEVRLSGTPNGYFVTRQSYKNYVLKFEWMYEKPEGFREGDEFDGNSGVFLHLAGPDKIWPECSEAQLAYSEAGRVFAINGARLSATFDRDAMTKARKPVGQWNEEEITCKDGAITLVLNGREISKGTGAVPSEGPIGFQSEGAPIRFPLIR